MKKAIIWGLLLVSFISCGKMEGVPGYKQEKVFYIEPATSEEYTYEFTNRECSTGEQSFSTFYDTCDGLKNEELNRLCAYEERKTIFEVSECPGSFDE
jgi:hypothetical protein